MPRVSWLAMLPHEQRMRYGLDWGCACSCTAAVDISKHALGYWPPQLPCTSNNDCSGPSSVLARPYNVYCDTATSLCHEQFREGAACTKVRMLCLVHAPIG